MRSRSYAQKIHSPFAATQILHLLNNTRKVRVCIFINTTLILLKRCYKIYVARILYHLCWQKSSIFLLLCKKFTLQSPCMKVKKFLLSLVRCTPLPALSKFSSDLGSMWAVNPTNQTSATHNLFQSPSQRHSRKKYAKKGGHLSITAANYLQNFGLTPFHITMSYD